jgi:hypothetical protein
MKNVDAAPLGPGTGWCRVSTASVEFPGEAGSLGSSPDLWEEKEGSLDRKLASLYLRGSVM